MTTMASQIASIRIVYSTAYSRCRSKKTSKFLVTGLCAGNSPVTGEFPHKWPVTRKMFPFDDVIMSLDSTEGLLYCRSSPSGTITNTTWNMLLLLRYSASSQWIWEIVLPIFSTGSWSIGIVVIKRTPKRLNSHLRSDAYMRQWTVSVSLQVMACCVFDAKLLPEPMLTYCELVP